MRDPDKLIDDGSICPDLRRRSTSAILNEEGSSRNSNEEGSSPRSNGKRVGERVGRGGRNDRADEIRVRASKKGERRTSALKHRIELVLPTHAAPEAAVPAAPVTPEATVEAAPVIPERAVDATPVATDSTLDAPFVATLPANEVTVPITPSAPEVAISCQEV